MSDEDFLKWMGLPVRSPCVLVEAGALVSGVETTHYLSTEEFNSGPDQTPASKHYEVRVRAGLVVSERLPINGEAAIAFSDIELINVDGGLDVWLEYIWTNRKIEVFIGDRSWQRDDFRLIFSGLIEDISSRSRHSLNLKIRDKSQRLNTALSDALLGGSTANADKLIPVCFGEVHNVEPLFADLAQLEYRLHLGPIERIIETRDFGVPVGMEENLSNASYELDARPAGQITNSVQGDKGGGVYRNTVAALVRRIATGFGADPLDDETEIDDVSFDSFEAANTQTVGFYSSDRINVLAACQALAASLGAQVVMSAAGKLRIIKIDLPPPGTPSNVDEQEMLAGEGEISLVQRIPVQAAVKIGYNRNYTVQLNLQTGIPTDHKDLYQQEWLTASASDPAVAAAYRITEAPIQQNTLLQVTSEAQAEADRRLTLWGSQRAIYGYTGLGSQIMLELGQGLTITASRFSMDAGVTGQVVGLEKDWINGTVRVEVLV